MISKRQDTTQLEHKEKEMRKTTLVLITALVLTVGFVGGATANPTKRFTPDQSMRW